MFMLSSCRGYTSGPIFIIDGQYPVVSDDYLRIESEYKRFLKETFDIGALDLSLARKYGTFNDVYVILYKSSFFGDSFEVIDEEINGFRFKFRGDEKMVVVSTLFFYNLAEAIQNEILSESDLEAIYNAYILFESDLYQ